MALWKNAILGLAAMAISGSLLSVVHAEDAVAEVKAEKAEKKAEKKAMKVFKPYGELTGLTDEQKAQISDIRKRTNDEIKSLKDKEKADIAAVLTDDQKAELAKLEETEMAGKKKVKEIKEVAPTTKPAAE